MGRFSFGSWLALAAAVAFVPSKCLAGVVWNVQSIALDAAETERIVPFDVYLDVNHGPFEGEVATAVFDITPEVPGISFVEGTMLSTPEHPAAFPDPNWFFAELYSPYRLAVSQASDVPPLRVPIVDDSGFVRLHVRVAPSVAGSFAIKFDQRYVGIAYTENGNVKVVPNHGFRDGLLTIQPRPVAASISPSIFWSNWSEGGIERSDLTGANVVGEVWNTARANHMIVDTRNRFLYWSDVDELSPALIWRSHLDGSSQELVLARPSPGVQRVSELAFDPDGGRIYYADGAYRAIRRVRTDGTGDEHFAAISQIGGNGLDIDVRNDYLYWTDSTPTSSRLLRARLDDGVPIELATGVGQFLDVKLDEIRNHVYWLHNADSESSYILRSDLDGLNQTTVLGPLDDNIGGIDIDPLRGKLYWSVQNGESSEVRRSNLDGSDAESVVTGQGVMDDLSIYYLPEYGDTNLDNVVDITDSATLARRFGMASGATWFDGDFNGDGAVDMIDVGLMQARAAPALNMQGTSSAVPEPSAAIIVLAAAVFCAVRRLGKQ